MMVYLRKLDSIRPPLLLTNNRRQRSNNCHTACLSIISPSHISVGGVNWTDLDRKREWWPTCQHGNSPAGPIKGRNLLATQGLCSKE